MVSLRAGSDATWPEWNTHSNRANFRNQMTEGFHETQRMRQWWFVAIVMVLIGLAMWAFVQQIILGEPWGTNPAPDWAVYLLVTFMLLLAWMLMSIRLIVAIDPIGIRYRFIPLHFRTRQIPWSDVSEAFVRQYKPIREYGGWGLRYGFRNGWAFNMSGNRGLQLVMRSGKRILLGTQRAEELGRYLQSIRTNTSP